jgi:hypothetical protein
MVRRVRAAIVNTLLAIASLLLGYVAMEYVAFSRRSSGAPRSRLRPSHTRRATGIISTKSDIAPSVRSSLRTCGSGLAPQVIGESHLGLGMAVGTLAVSYIVAGRWQERPGGRVQYTGGAAVCLTPAIDRVYRIVGNF